MTVSNTLADLLGIPLPIIQAPMAGSQDSALAAAVCNSGALGSLPCALLSVDGIRSQLQQLTAASDGPYNVNFFCHSPPAADSTREARWRALLRPYYDELGLDPDDIPSGPGRHPFSAEAADVLEEFRPAVVSFHFGLPPEPLLNRVRALGAKVLSTATTVQEAMWLEAHGVDAIIVQGLEAGGHRGHFLRADLAGQDAAFSLMAQVRGHVKVPVIVAGGIVDAKGVHAALQLGAAGVQIGTTYLLCDEATTSAVHRAALQSSAREHTAITNLFTGRPARGIVNRLMREIGPLNPAAPEFPLATTAIAPLRAAGEKAGTGDFSSMWAGRNTNGCRAVSARVITETLAEGA